MWVTAWARYRLISIHSPRMGRDGIFAMFNPPFLYFNPLSPHGERHKSANYDEFLVIFQSTLPAWGETRCFIYDAETADISIHSPRMGRDIKAVRKAAGLNQFQSTLPAWGETHFIPFWWALCPFQSTLPAWGETVRHGLSHGLAVISIHSPRMGRDETGSAGRRTAADFNPLSPHGERP